MRLVLHSSTAEWRGMSLSLETAIVHFEGAPLSRR